ncbi:IseA DL-endopeptidase inhibitor family protein [Rossellomorea vietnamensis]|uniref:IseA DL-endopeptidase inhibitor family protein n=1 Tax=Rossellomorea vietnamensis TaxID=218284 RepID=A0ACD4C1X8_9BACI|nr:IseA DL-endopeptidase inhibitor family protein [Rossellomorea vietnamensis]UXH42585.1 IseA DL-endopeptidase inhibitor family protein [Rossellomorea vietnamensis]
MNEKFNDDFLQSLKKRPDLAPRKEFKQELKTKLLNEMSDTEKSRGKMRSLVPNILAAAFILAGVFLTFELIGIGRDGQNASREQDSIEQVEPTSQEPTELDESTADKLIGEAFSRYDHILNDEGTGETFIFEGKPYRYMSGELDSKEKVIRYLSESFTPDAAEKLIGDLPFITFKGKLAQPDVSYEPGQLWTATTAIKVRTSETMSDVTYEIPVSEGYQKASVQTFRLLYDDGWKFSVVMPFSFRKVEKVETDSRSPFTLTQEEKDAYQEFSEDPTEVHLKGLSPISLAKLYVQASLDERYDLVYEMYTDRPDYIRWTKEEDEEIPKTDRGTKENILNTFKGIENGEFIQTSDIDGYIKYDNVGEGTMGFQMIKDEDGYWSVGFMPTQ